MRKFAKTRSTRVFTDYEDQTDNENSEEFVVPENLAELSTEEVTALHTQAVEHFNTIYADGSAALTEADIEALGELTGAIETLRGNLDDREAEAAQRATAAAELAARVAAPVAEAETAEETATDGDSGEENAESGEVVADEVLEPVVASARRETRLKISRTNARNLPSPQADSGIESVLRAAGDGSGFAAGTGIDWTKAGEIVDRRLGAFNLGQYQAAHRSGTHLRQQFSVATVHKNIPQDHIVSSNDPTHVEEVLSRATREKNLPKGSLIASGGWCAPSETIYDLLELESRDGLFSLPEIGVTRGGLSRTLGPKFSDLFADITGFNYSETNDIDGEYGVDANGIGNGEEGDKPCYKIECPDFDEYRLGVDGLCITAGLLQQRGYPEVIARTLRGALVAHDHRRSGRILTAVANGSTAVTMPSVQVGAVAPILTAIELQAEHMRYTERLSRTATLEGVFPYWIRGAIRSDLSRRLGVDMLSVPDSRIAAWFTERQIAPQFVYNWQDINGTAANAFTQWPTTVDFLLYPAGSWVQGSSDVITLDTMYDSTMLGQNDYTALFTEEGWMVVPMGHDSRKVTVSLTANGATHQGLLIEHDGTETPAPVVDNG